MLVDRSSRVWAMRRDTVVSAHVAQMREQHHQGETPAALAMGDTLDGSDFARVIDGVAIIPVFGPLMRTFSFWMWSYEEISRDLRLAEASPRVRSIVLDIDSPGGLVAGCGDTAALIRAINKPVTGFVGGMAASAAYWLASACDRIEVGSGGTLGSIGAVIEYVDVEPMFEAMGARIIRVVSEQSPNKRLDPQSPEGEAEMQALVDASAAEFIAGVAAGRGLGEAEVMERFGQGLMFDRAEAIRRGMADAKATLETTVAALADRVDQPNAAPAPAAQEDPMDWASITTAALREHRPELVDEIEASAATAATEKANKANGDAAQAAATAERERILAIDEIATSGHDDLVAAAKADGKTTAAELALQILKADKAAGASTLAVRQAAEEGAAVVPVQPRSTTGTATGSIEDRAKAEWDKDAALRAEFRDDFNSYLAFRKAEENGAVRIKRAG